MELEKGEKVFGWIAFIILIIIGINYCSTCGMDESEQKETREELFEDTTDYPPQLKKEIDSTMRIARESGFVKKVQPKLNRVYVNPLMWAKTNVEEKKSIAVQFAAYLNLQKNTDAEIVQIYSFQSGEKLASYNSVTGFKVH